MTFIIYTHLSHTPYIIYYKPIILYVYLYSIVLYINSGKIKKKFRRKVAAIVFCPYLAF